MSVSQYLAHIKDLANEVLAIGEPLSYRDHLAYILKGLGLEYNPFVTSIQNKIDRPILVDVRSLLLAYEAHLDQQTTMDQLNSIQENLANLRFQNTQQGSNKDLGTSKPFSFSHPSSSMLGAVNPIGFSSVFSSGLGAMGNQSQQNCNQKWPSKPRP